MLTDRGFGERNRRLRSLDVESYQDFVLGFRAWTYNALDQATRKRADALLSDAGIVEQTATMADLRTTLESDPLVATRVRCWLTSQQLMWRNILDHYEQHADVYLDEMEATDDTGPGSLELNTGMTIPEYAQHEIHIQPGGYTGNRFAGPLYHYGTDTFYRGQSSHDQFHIGIAQNAYLPADGKVARVVDLGCGIGRLTVALAERFPDAEVWGLDIGGPLVRYAHKRAVDLDVPVHFAQRLAEDTKFASGSVDLVTAYILFHEVPREARHAICAEAFRILRPGGVLDVTDFHTGAARVTDPYPRYLRWVDHVYNAERWSHDFIHDDFGDALRGAGFVLEPAPNRHWGVAAYIARKPE